MAEKRESGNSKISVVLVYFRAIHDYILIVSLLLFCIRILFTCILSPSYNNHAFIISPICNLPNSTLQLDLGRLGYNAI